MPPAEASEAEDSDGSTISRELPQPEPERSETENVAEPVQEVEVVETETVADIAPVGQEQCGKTLLQLSQYQYLSASQTLAKPLSSDDNSI